LNVDEAFGKALKHHREQKGLSQEELAFESGLHRTYISLIERGKRSPSLRTVDKIAVALGSRLSSLLKELDRYRGRKNAPR
jgi:transcriptional regulator with XRE-family HTH domain